MSCPVVSVWLTIILAPNQETRILRNAGELLNLVIFPDKGLYHTDAVEVFLCHVVQLIIGFEHPFENGVYPCHNEIQSHAQHRNCRQIDQ